MHSLSFCLMQRKTGRTKGKRRSSSLGRDAASKPPVRMESSPHNNDENRRFVRHAEVRAWCTVTDGERDLGIACSDGLRHVGTMTLAGKTLLYIREMITTHENKRKCNPHT